MSCYVSKDMFESAQIGASNQLQLISTSLLKIKTGGPNSSYAVGDACK